MFYSIFPAKIEGLTIQPMLTGYDHELILGVKKDRDFGPVILFGMGGVYAEVLQDRAIVLPPLNRLPANRLMEGTKVYRLLKGYRHIQLANLPLLEETLIRPAQLVTDFSEIEELDINPLALVALSESNSQESMSGVARIIVTATAVAPDRHPGMLPGASELKVKLVFADRSGIILGGQVSGGPLAGELINMIALAIEKEVTIKFSLNF